MRIENLSIGYKDKIVASGLNAGLRDGELTCLFGTNGVGKSTLLRTLIGFQPTLNGNINFSFPSMGGGGERGFSSIVLTDKPDIQNMSVEELVGLGRSPYTGFFGTLKEIDKQAVAEAMGLVGIANLAKRNFANLSDGEKQKVMIAKALAQETPIVYMDEPTAFLDYPSKIETFQLLARIAKERDKAILVSTHDFELALRHCHRVWILDKEDGLTTALPEEVTFDINKRKFIKQ